MQREHAISIYFITRKEDHRNATMTYINWLDFQKNAVKTLERKFPYILKYSREVFVKS